MTKKTKRERDAAITPEAGFDLDPQLGASVFELAVAYRAAEYRFQKYRRTHQDPDVHSERMLDDLMQRKNLLFAVVDNIVGERQAAGRA